MLVLTRGFVFSYISRASGPVSPRCVLRPHAATVLGHKKCGRVQCVGCLGACRTKAKHFLAPRAHENPSDILIVQIYTCILYIPYYSTLVLLLYSAPIGTARGRDLSHLSRFATILVYLYTARGHEHSHLSDLTSKSSAQEGLKPLAGSRPCSRHRSLCANVAYPQLSASSPSVHRVTGAVQRPRAERQRCWI